MEKTPKIISKNNSVISRVQNELKKRIVNGDIKPGERLPSEPDLASELGKS